MGWKTPRGERTTLKCFPHSYKFTRSHRSFISFQTFPSFCQPQDPEQLKEGSLLRPRGRIKPKSSILGTITLANRLVHLFPASLSQSKGVFGRIAPIDAAPCLSYMTDAAWEHPAGDGENRSGVVRSQHPNAKVVTLPTGQRIQMSTSPRAKLETCSVWVHSASWEGLNNINLYTCLTVEGAFCVEMRGETGPEVEETQRKDSPPHY